MNFEELLVVQELDTQITQLQHRLTHDVVHAQLAEAKAALAGIEVEQLELFGKRDAVRQEQRRLEDEVAGVEAKIEKDTGTLYGGVVTAHKELESLQAELATLRQRQADFEDQIIEQMELAEPLDQLASELETLHADATARVGDSEMAVTVMQAEVSSALDTAMADRASRAAAIPVPLMDRYETIRRASGQGAARLAPGGRCEGCHLSLPSAEYDQIKHAPADEIVTCPECGRILVR